MKLSDYRKSKGYTQEALAKVSGVSRSSIAGHETGAQNLSYSAFAAIVYALKLSPKEIGEMVIMSHLTGK